MFVSISFIIFISFPGILAFDEKNNEASMSNIVMLHLSSNGDYSTSNKLLNQQPLNHPVKSSMTGRLDIIIGMFIIHLILLFISHGGQMEVKWWPNEEPNEE